MMMEVAIILLLLLVDFSTSSNVSMIDTFYISKSGNDSETCGTFSNPCNKLQQVWKQIEQLGTLNTSTTVVTDTDIFIDHEHLILQNNQDTFHQIHIMSIEDRIQININHSTFKYVTLKLDNTNISLDIENSSFISAGISIQSLGNKRHLPVKIKNCHFSGHSAEHTLFIKETENVFIESSNFTDFQFHNKKSFMVKAVQSVLHIENSQFRNNTSCMKVQSSIMNISMSLFDGNTAKYGGAMHVYDNSQVTIERSSFTHNTATGKDWRHDGGGAIYIENGTSVEIIDSCLVNNTAGNHGGAVFALDINNVRIENSSLTGNTARGLSGAIDIKHGASLQIIDSSLVNNTGVGGAVFADAINNVRIENSSLTGNTARGRYGTGGAIDIKHGVLLQIIDSSLVKNTGHFGGAVFADAVNNVRIEKSSLTGNTGFSNGGAVLIHDAVLLQIIDSSLVNNTGNRGGAVIISTYAVKSVTRISGSNFTGNTAGRWGGALFVERSQVIFNRNMFVNNSAKYDGGALFITENSVINMTSTTFTNNTSMRDGGAIFIGKTLWLDGNCIVNITLMIFTNNTSMRDGGAIMIEDRSTVVTDDSVFTESTCRRDGGAIKVHKSSVMEMSSVKFVKSKAKRDGGAILITENSVINMTSITFTNNTCKQDGGAILIADRSTVFTDNSVFTESKCGKDGGAIKVQLNSEIFMTSVYFANNIAGSGGGAIMVLEESELHDTGSIFSQNRALGSGGAISLIDYCHMFINGSSFTENKAQPENEYIYSPLCPEDIELEEHGGALLIQTSSKANITNCHFSDNQATDDGGAIYVKIAMSLNVSNSWFQRNTAQDSGGSVAVLDSHVFIRSSHFLSESVSHSFGGSICLLDASDIHIEYSQFINCAAGIGGTFSLLLGSNMHIEHSSIVNSTSNTSAGAVYLNAHSVLNGRNLSIVDCKGHDGGGIHAEESSLILLSDSLISTSVAFSGNGGGISSVQSKIELHNCSISRNRGSNHGGGLYLEGSEVTMNNVSFDMNFAVLNGGGLLAKSSHIAIHNSEGENNYAEQSGGLMFLERSRLVCQHVHVYDNMAFSGSIIAIKHSHAEVNFLYYGNYQSFCPITASRGSFLKVHGLYGTYNTSAISPQNETITSVISPQNETISLKGHVCRDSKSEVEGTPFTESYPYSCEKVCKCYSNHHQRLLVADCSYSGLLDFPTSLPNVHWLILSSNNITNLPSDKFNFYDILFINLANNSLSSIPKSIEKASSLTYLYLSYNNLEKFPSGILSTASLMSLDLAYNQIESLPTSIQNMTSLTYLNVSHNKILLLPYTIVKMPSLTHFNVSHNLLTIIPQTIKNMSSLKDLRISSNKFECKCEMSWMKYWIGWNKKMIPDYYKTKCKMSPKRFINIVVVSEREMGCSKPEYYTPSWVIQYYITMAAVCPVLWVLTFIVIYYWKEIMFKIYLRFNIKPNERMDKMKDPDEFDYDVFISHYDTDLMWVKRNLIKVLEDKGYSYCLEAKDFVGGKSIQTNLSLAMTHSRKMILVITRKYLEWDWGVESFLQGYAESKEKNADRDYLIPIVLEDNLPKLVPREIHAHLKAKRYIDARKLDTPKDIDIFKKRLLFAMPKKPLKDFPRNNEPEELNLKDRKFKPPPLYYRVHKYNEWKKQNVPREDIAVEVPAGAKNPERLNAQAAADVKPAGQVKRSNIEIDPEDPEYYEDDKIRGFDDIINDEDSDDYHDKDYHDMDDNSDDNDAPRTVVVDVDVHAHY